MPVGEWLELIKIVGPVAALSLFALWRGYKQDWVWGWQLKEMRDDRDRWRDQFMSLMQVTAKSVDTKLPAHGG